MALYALLGKQVDVLKQRLKRSDNVEAFLVELKDVMERLLASSVAAVLPPASYYQRLVAELDAVGWDKLASLDASMTILNLLI